MQKTVPVLRRAVMQPRKSLISTRPASLFRNSLTRRYSPIQSRIQQHLPVHHRWASSLSVPESEKRQDDERRPMQPSYQLTFTCKPCGHRAPHVITKQAYHHGSVLIQCPQCKNRHVITDHLKIFSEQAMSLEDILKRTAGTDKDISKLLKKGTLGQRSGQMVGNAGEEDLEFWDDGTVTKHTPASDNK